MGRTSQSSDKLTYYERCRLTATKRWQRWFLLKALQRAGGNVSLAADYCGVDRSNFRRLMKQVGVKRARRPPVTPQPVKVFPLKNAWWRSDS